MNVKKKKKKKPLKQRVCKEDYIQNPTECACECDQVREITAYLNDWTS